MPSPQDLVKWQLEMLQLSMYLTSSCVMPMVLVFGPHFRLRGLKVSWRKILTMPKSSQNMLPVKPNSYENSEPTTHQNFTLSSQNHPIIKLNSECATLV